MTVSAGHPISAWWYATNHHIHHYTENHDVEHHNHSYHDDDSGIDNLAIRRETSFYAEKTLSLYPLLCPVGTAASSIQLDGHESLCISIALLWKTDSSLIALSQDGELDATSTLEAAKAVIFSTLAMLNVVPNYSRFHASCSLSTA